jgi:hypothetical protein
MATFYSPNVVTNGLVMCLDAANARSYPGSGTSWFDLSGNGRTGTLTNGPTFTSNNGGGIVFDGTNDYVGISSAVLTGGGDFTVNAWIKCDAGETGGTVFGNYPAGNLQIFYGSTYMGMWLANSSTYVDSPVPFSSNSTMITAIRSGTTTYFYQNGTLLKTGSSSSTIGTTSDFRLGENTSAGEEYTGTIHIIQVYNVALSAAEVSQNFNALRRRFGV